MLAIALTYSFMIPITLAWLMNMLAEVEARFLIT